MVDDYVFFNIWLSGGCASSQSEVRMEISHETIVQDNCQLEVVSQSVGSEIDHRWVQEDLAVPLWVYMCLHVPEHQNSTNI